VSWFDAIWPWIFSGGAFIVVLGVVVLFHEFGHYITAKLFGITVEVFSVGFGPRIWGVRRGGTDYRVSWVPLGGYVKLKGETPEESTPQDPGDLLARPRWQRFLVFVMGAVFNLVTAYVIIAAIMMTGVEEPAYPLQPPVVGEVEPDSQAQKAGIEAGDRIVSFGGKEVATWKDLEFLILVSPGQTKEVFLDRGGRRIAATLEIGTDRRQGVGVASIGPATGVLVGELQPGRPAAEAGLRRGDRIISIGGTPITTLARVFRAIQSSAGVPLTFVIERDGETFEKVITPVKDGERGIIGFVPTYPTVVRAYPVGEALVRAFWKNVEDAGQAFTTLRMLVTRELSLRTVSGPIGLYLASGAVAAEGLAYFLKFIAFVSLQLGIINLLPLPPLDGGHIFTITIEGIIRRDLSIQLKERVMQAGLILLLMFMGTVIYLDISKLIQR
jgi:regulator of sigma E protease